MRAFLGFLLLVAALALGAWVGWWTVPAVAALWGWLRPAVRRPVASAAFAAALAWGLWLWADAIRGHGALGRLGAELAGVMRVPALVLYLVTLLFAALLGWSAAALACAARRGLPSRTGDAR